VPVAPELLTVPDGDPPTTPPVPVPPPAANGGPR
jgi:hypothetical protein